MAQRGCSARILTVGILLSFVLQYALVVEGATYVVGDHQGWGFQIQSSRWTVGKNFKAGDNLVFNYNAEHHNVVVVNSRGYSSCTTGGSVALTSGTDTVTLKKGVNYFICGVPGHCAAGMKLAITAV